MILLPILAIGMAVLTLGSCKKSDIKSLKEMKKDERKAIESFINRMGFTIKEGHEGQSEFDPDIMYHFDNDLYMQVLDKGKEPPVLNKTKINVRMRRTPSMSSTVSLQAVFRRAYSAIYISTTMGIFTSS